VTTGQWVAKGEPIGLAGSTGRARGPHLHFEMRENGQAFDSELVFDYKNQKIRLEACDMESLMALHKKLKPKGYSTNVAVPEFYKVRSGDSLWVISRKFKTPINEICRLNSISESSTLQIGQPLKLY
jgi:murein DD-endopeptidase MepM/ murein hydrolase activator NlpD